MINNNESENRKSTLVINDDLAFKLAENDWAKKVRVTEFRNIKDSYTPSYHIDIDTNAIIDRKEYEELLSQIVDSLPDIEFTKEISRYDVKLSYNDNTDDMMESYHLIISIPCYKGLDVMSEIADCELIEVKHSYTDIVCKVKS